MQNDNDEIWPPRSLCDQKSNCISYSKDSSQPTDLAIITSYSNSGSSTKSVWGSPISLSQTRKIDIKAARQILQDAHTEDSNIIHKLESHQTDKIAMYQSQNRKLSEDLKIAKELLAEQERYYEKKINEIINELTRKDALGWKDEEHLGSHTHNNSS